MTQPQRRLLAEIKAQGGDGEYGAEYWPVVNEWTSEGKTPDALALRNIVRSFDALLRLELVTLDDDGYIRVTEKGATL